MFDKLVESGVRVGRGQTGKYFFGASLLYAFGLLTVAITTVMWFNPGMAEAFELSARLTPPVPMTGPTQPSIISPRSFSSGSGNPVAFIPPQPTSDPNIGQQLPLIKIPGDGKQPLGNTGGSSYSGPSLDGPISSGNNTPAPPPPTPTPTPQSAPSPTVATTQRVSERVLQGNAINRITPPYPEIAKRARIQGAVQILVTISEEGKVTDATTISGPPLLRAAAIDAARKWYFTPTRIGSVPVKLQGVLTFNFVLD